MMRDTHRCPHCDGTGWTCELHRRPERRIPTCHGPLEVCQCPIGRMLERRLDQRRAEGGTVRLSQRLEPVIPAPPLWVLKKGIHEASAHVRSIDGVGLELRFMIDGELRHSELCRDWRLLEQAAAEKKTDFPSRGWQ